MNKLAILCTAVAITLAGCKTEQVSNSAEQLTSSSPAESVVTVVKAPNGRWFSNPLHCSGKLPIAGTYDFSVEGNTLTYIGIADNGAWKDDSQNEQSRKAFTDILLAESKCLSNASISEFEMIKFVGKITEYWFGYSEKKNLLLRYNNGTVDIITPFDLEKIKLLQLEETSEVSMPIDEVSPPIEQTDGESTKTASH